MRSVMMRCNQVLIPDVPALPLALGKLRSATLVMDVEPLVVPWNSAPMLFADAAYDFAQSMRATVPSPCPGATGGRSCIRIIAAARKLWRTRYLRDEPRPIAVAGDQALTAELLAWRLGASFLHWQVAGPMPQWPPRRWLGRIAASFLFRAEDGSST
jgi:hypothetical protein